MRQNRISGKGPWDYILPDRIRRFGPEVGDPDTRSRWCQAFFYGGNTLRLWNEAVELKAMFLSACAVGEGQRIILIAKYADESGLAPALSSLLGQKGRLSVEEIGPQAIAAFQKTGSTSATPLAWDFHYCDSLPDESVDRVILFGAASHVGNWADLAPDIHRVLRNGGRVIVADAPWGGQELLTAAHTDTHLKSALTLMLTGMGLEEEDLPQTSPDELSRLFQPLLRWSRAFSWRGMYLFYGQKGGKEGEPAFGFPRSTGAVQAFLTEKPRQTPWDFLADAEVAALGAEVRDADTQKKWGRIYTFGGGLEWMLENSPSIIDLMYRNLRAKTGYRALVIGEQFEQLGYLTELRKRVGDRAEVVAFDMNIGHREIFKQLWEHGPDFYIPQRHQWDYPYAHADEYPESYFDLVWLPQGVHHAPDWKEIAPKLVRVLKPGGQIMMSECRIGHPGFHAALKMSGLLECVVEKMWWAMHVTFDEMPDYSTADLALAFGDSLTDIYSLEWCGWLLFWGYKK